MSAMLSAKLRAREESAKARIRRILEAADRGDRTSAIFDAALLTLILANVAAAILESEPALFARYGLGFRIFEAFSVLLFTIEYGLRLWSAPADPAFAGRFGRLRWALTPMAIVDFVAVFPWYLSAVYPIDLRVLRAVRLARLFKLGRRSSALQLFGRVIAAKKDELLLALGVLLFALLVSSSLMYALEHDAQPEAFRSIPKAMWWGAVTLATVGYGDVVPVTTAGKAVGGAVILLGIAVYALPIAVLTSGFTDELSRRRKRRENCPHCGEELP